MSQISGAIIGVTVVLISVFVPLAFFAGAVGNIYRQFSAVMVSSIAFSAFLALSLTPALCANLLKPVEAGHHMEKRGFFGWFNRTFSANAKRYEGFVGKLLRRTGRALLVFVLLIGLVGLVFVRMPNSFLPNEDQGYIIANIQLPPGATAERTSTVLKAMEDYVLKQPEVADMVAVTGFSFSGQGQNMGLAFIPLKPWDQRKGKGQGAQDLATRITMHMGALRDSFIFAVSPPPIPELGRGTGFSFRLQDRAGLGHAALLQARNQLLGMAMKDPVLTSIRPEGLEDAPQVQLEIDRDKAQALGVNFDAINAALSTSIGSSYVNDFPNACSQKT
jgi:multidrug efflux pump